MKLYLMRHCATDEGPQMDAERPINDLGELQAHSQRKMLKLIGVQPDVIIRSDFLRAEQTAAIMQRKDTPIKVTPALRPEAVISDKYVAKALKAINTLAGDAKAVLVVTHGPLIQRLLAAVAFCFVDTKWEYEHGAIAYVNTHECRFRWFLTPKIAAHATGEPKNPKDVENPKEAEEIGRGLIKFAESLRRAHRAEKLDPLRRQLEKGTAARFAVQRGRVLKALRPFRKHFANGTANYGAVKQAIQSSIPFQDPRFAKIFSAATDAAHSTGYTDAGESLGLTWSMQEASIPPPTKPKRTPQQLESELDDTTGKQISDAIDQASDPLKPLSYAALIGVVRDRFAQYQRGIEDQKSRSLTVAGNEISTAYHGGGSDAADAAPGAVEKQWDIGGDGCAICQGNADDGWISDDDAFSSGDQDPPAHVNCDCSENFRMAGE